MITCNQLRKLLENTELYIRSYSGRFMYGKNCVGITTDNPVDCVLDIVSEYIALSDDDRQVYLDGDTSFSLGDLIDALKDNRQDSMGRSQIIYWPNIDWEAESEPEPEPIIELMTADKFRSFLKCHRNCFNYNGMLAFERTNGTEYGDDLYAIWQLNHDSSQWLGTHSYDETTIFFPLISFE